MFLPISCTSPLTVAIRTLPAASTFPSFSASINGCKCATAFFITRALFTTWGKNIFPAPNKSPTTFIPAIRGPSITWIGLSCWSLASSVSSTMKSTRPFTKACSNRFETGSFLHSSSITSIFLSPLTVSANSSNLSVESSLRLSNTSSTRSNKSLGMLSYTSSMAGFTIPMVIPFFIAWYKKAECIASRTVLLPRKEKETLLTPPLILAPGRFSVIHFVALKKSKALLLCSSIPVATGKILGSKIMSWQGNPTLSTKTS